MYCNKWLFTCFLSVLLRFSLFGMCIRGSGDCRSSSNVIARWSELSSFVSPTFVTTFVKLSVCSSRSGVVSELLVIKNVGGVCRIIKSELFINVLSCRRFRAFTLKSPIRIAFLYSEALVRIVCSMSECG